jgi:hypothetical protein
MHNRINKSFYFMAYLVGVMKFNEYIGISCRLLKADKSAPTVIPFILLKAITRKYFY